MWETTPQVQRKTIIFVFLRTFQMKRNEIYNLFGNCLTAPKIELTNHILIPAVILYAYLTFIP